MESTTGRLTTKSKTAMAILKIEVGGEKIHGLLHRGTCLN
jgi:hypothetical protein